MVKLKGLSSGSFVSKLTRPVAVPGKLETRNLLFCC